MTLGQFRELTKDMPDDLQVLMELEDGTVVNVCNQNSKVLEMHLMDDDSEDIYNINDDTFVNDFLDEIEDMDLTAFENDEDDEDIETMNVLLLVRCNHTDEEQMDAINPTLN